MSKAGLCAVLSASAFGVLFPDVSRASSPPVVGGIIVVNSTKDIIATYLGNSASYEDDLYLATPTNALGRIFGNHIDAVGTTKDLGSYPVGTQLTFSIHVTNTGNIFYSGDGSQNADNHAHARVTYDYTPTSSLVEFEDLLGGPYDYNDLSFSFSNVGVLHPMISFTSAVPSVVYGSQITNGSGAGMGAFSNGLSTLTVTGSKGNYLPSQVTRINSATGTATGYVAASGFNPVTDREIYAMDVLINGVQATPSQITTLAGDINSSSAFGFGSNIASLNDPSNGAFAALQPSTPYNLFLTFTGVTSGSNDLGFDLTQDPTYGATATVVAIAVVPEPGSTCFFLCAAARIAAGLRRRRVR